MNHEKSFVYTLILGVCMLISLILIGKMLLYCPVPIHTPIVSGEHTHAEEKSKDKEDNSVQLLREADVAKMVSERLPENFPVTGMSVKLFQNGTVQTEGILSKGKLKQLIPANTGMRSALLLLPPEFTVRATLTATCLDDGTLSLTPKEISAEGVTLPIDIFPPLVTDSLNQVVNEVLKESYPDYQTIRFEDGMIELIG